jgi:hypothetical protein
MIVIERTSLLKEQIKPENKPQVNKTLSLQVDAVRSAAEDIENVESVISQKNLFALIFYMPSYLV